MEDTNTLKDLSRNCRLCLGNINELDVIDISDMHGNFIFKITNIKLIEMDYLPKYMCTKCQIDLDFIKAFIDTCIKNNEFLLKNIGDNSKFNAKGNDKIIHKFEGKSNPNISSEIKLEVLRSNMHDRIEQNTLSKTGVHCKQCQKYFADTEFERHMNGQTCMYSSGVICIVCDYVATCKESLKVHDIEHKFGKKWKCNQCEKMYVKKHTLKLHLSQTHRESKPFCCNICKTNFVSQGTLKRHQFYIHGSETVIYECYICEKKFNRKDNLESHMKSSHIKKQRKHFDNFEPVPNKFLCKICNKTFSISSYLENHLKAHKFKSKKSRVVVNNIRCKFLTTSTLCCICGKSLMNKKSYYAHMKKHSKHQYSSRLYIKDKTNNHFQCVTCGKIITKLQNLRVHMRIHAGEKPYECKFCLKKFTHHTSWSAHENIHTGNKPFQCIQCNRSFTHRSCLRKHMRSSIHSDSAEVTHSEVKSNG